MNLTLPGAFVGTFHPRTRLYSSPHTYTHLLYTRKTHAPHARLQGDTHDAARTFLAGTPAPAHTARTRHTAMLHTRPTTCPHLQRVPPVTNGVLPARHPAMLYPSAHYRPTAHYLFSTHAMVLSVLSPFAVYCGATYARFAFAPARARTGAYSETSFNLCGRAGMATTLTGLPALSRSSCLATSRDGMNGRGPGCRYAVHPHPIRGSVFLNIPGGCAMTTRVPSTW